MKGQAILQRKGDKRRQSPDPGLEKGLLEKVHFLRVEFFADQFLRGCEGTVAENEITLFLEVENFAVGTMGRHAQARVRQQERPHWVELVCCAAIVSTKYSL